MDWRDKAKLRGYLLNRVCAARVDSKCRRAGGGPDWRVADLQRPFYWGMGGEVKYLLNVHTMLSIIHGVMEYEAQGQRACITSSR